MLSFHNLDVYKKIYALNGNVYSFLKHNNQLPSFMKNQLSRATISIMLNIAEGCGRPTSKDRRNFYVIARSSAFECASIIEFLHSQEEVSLHNKEEWLAGDEEISKMLYAMIRKLE